MGGCSPALDAQIVVSKARLPALGSTKPILLHDWDETRVVGVDLFVLP